MYMQHISPYIVPFCCSPYPGLDQIAADKVHKCTGEVFKVS